MDRSSAGDRNIYIVLVIAAALEIVSIYGTVNTISVMADYGFHWSLYFGIILTALSLFGLFTLFQRKTVGWVITTGLFAYSVVGSLRFIALIGLTALGFNFFGSLGIKDLQPALITTAVGLLLRAGCAYLLLQRATREDLGISRNTMNVTLIVAIGLALLELLIIVASEGLS